MNVKELKSILELCPDDAPVVFDTIDFGFWGINEAGPEKVYGRPGEELSYYRKPSAQHVDPIWAVILGP